MHRIAKVKKPGLFTTIQDLGRPNHRSMGIPLCGALDPQSMIVANLLVGNEENLPVLEITQLEPVLEFSDYGAFALMGAELSARLNDTAIKPGETIFFSRGDVLSFGNIVAGYRAYLAVSGGFQAEVIVGSASTHQGTVWGGLNGRPLKVGDVLHSPIKLPTRRILKSSFNSFSQGQHTLRVIPHIETPLIDRNLLSIHSWYISGQSNRTGIRLEGDTIPFDHSYQMISSPTDVGTVQLPPSGHPIVLMNDGAAVGGYLRIASIAKVDLPILAQLKPGDPIHFAWIELTEARHLLQKQTLAFRALVESLKPLS